MQNIFVRFLVCKHGHGHNFLAPRFIGGSTLAKVRPCHLGPVQPYDYTCIIISFQKYDTPWLAIWTSPAVWALIVAHFCNNWGFYTFLTCLPSYFKEVLNFSISQVSNLVPMGQQLSDSSNFSVAVTSG